VSAERDTTPLLYLLRKREISERWGAAQGEEGIAERTGAQEKWPFGSHVETAASVETDYYRVNFYGRSKSGYNRRRSQSSQLAFLKMW